MYHRQCGGNLERGLPPPQVNNQMPNQQPTQGGIQGPELQAPVQVVTVEEPATTDVQAIIRHKDKEKTVRQDAHDEDVASTSRTSNMDVGQMARAMQDMLNQL
ncbi:hypothetical protein O6H91_21G069700 [Diphasiastrum complanatum]|uniref:Uncharacterized protein n=1 Tax=Diphasiastrum complanatum TaxID=34168 RepID=A0ACC2ALK5_DIPCM|nr:hypothetical protein O6H91_21G069700 [Diphasiastrum complanatum]